MNQTALMLLLAMMLMPFAVADEAPDAESNESSEESEGQATGGSCRTMAFNQGGSITERVQVDPDGCIRRAVYDLINAHYPSNQNFGGNPIPPP